MNENPERLLSTIAGATAIVFGIRARGAARTIAVASGATAVAYGLIGRSRIREVIDNAPSDQRPLTRVITVGKPKEELYSRWNDPQFMSSVFGRAFQIRDEGEGRIHVEVSLPGGRSLQWISRVIEQQPNSRIVWRTESGVTLPHEMFVEFRDAKPTEWGTEITFGLAPIAGQRMSGVLLRTSEFIATTVLNKVLRRFKALVETGEVPTLTQNPAGRPRLLAAA